MRPLLRTVTYKYLLADDGYGHHGEETGGFGDQTLGTH